MLKAYFQKVRDEYSHEAKKRVAFTAAAIITAIVFLIWISFSLANLSTSVNDKKAAVAEDKVSPFSQLGQAWKAAFGSSTK